MASEVVDDGRDDRAAARPLVSAADARLVGRAAAIAEDDDGGGRVFVHGNLAYAWDGGDTAGRRFAAVSLTRIKAATQLEVAAAFAVKPATVRRWEARLTGVGVAGLLAVCKGPKRKSKLTGDTVAAIRRLREGGASYRGIAAETGVSEGSVRDALRFIDSDTDIDTDERCGPSGLRWFPLPGAGAGAGPEPEPVDVSDAQSEPGCPATFSGAVAVSVTARVPVLADPVNRAAERALALFGLIPYVPPVFTGCARAPFTGLLLALPASSTATPTSTAASTPGASPTPKSPSTSPRDHAPVRRTRCARSACSTPREPARSRPGPGGPRCNRG